MSTTSLSFLTPEFIREHLPGLQIETPTDDACKTCGGQGFEEYRDGKGYVFTRPCSVCNAERREEWINKVRESWHTEIADTFGYRHNKRVDLIRPLKLLGAGLITSACAAYLHGETGTGKTQQAAEFCRRLLERHLDDLSLFDAERFGFRVPAMPDVVLVTELKMFDSLRPGGGMDVSYYENAPWLILDEVGIATYSPWKYAILSQILDHRYRHKMTTVFTSNLSPAHLGSSTSTEDGSVVRGLWDRRLTDRVLEMCGGRAAEEQGRLLVVHCGTRWR